MPAEPFSWLSPWSSYLPGRDDIAGRDWRREHMPPIASSEFTKVILAGLTPVDQSQDD